MTKSTILHIGAKKEALTKRQKEFNRLTQKIEQLEESLSEFRGAKVNLHDRINKEMAPVLNQLKNIQVQMVQAMDLIFNNEQFKKGDQKKLSHIIVDICFDLISKHGVEELKPVFNKYNDDDYDTVNAEVDRQAAEMAKGMASMFGVEFDDEDDISTPDKFNERMFEKFSEMEAEDEERQRIREEKKAARPKSQKQIEREEKKKLHEQNATRSVRTIYMDLVKAFHPDREHDQDEKMRKTEIMQRVTQAYNENNLMALLRLQMEFNRIDNEHLEKLADEQLLYYNKVLKEQVADLEESMLLVQEELAQLCDMEPYEIHSAESITFKFNRDLRSVKKNLKDAKKDIGFWSDPLSVKAYLKTYKIPKDDMYNFF